MNIKLYIKLNKINDSVRAASLRGHFQIKDFPVRLPACPCLSVLFLAAFGGGAKFT